MAIESTLPLDVCISFMLKIGPLLQLSLTLLLLGFSNVISMPKSLHICKQ